MISIERYNNNLKNIGCSFDFNHEVITKSELELLIRECSHFLSKPYVLIDVRNRKEVEETGRIESSFNLPLDEIEQSFNLNDKEFEKKYSFSKPMKTDNIIFYCLRGRRSSMAIEKFKIAGYHSLINYSGSAKEWFNLDI